MFYLEQKSSQNIFFYIFYTCNTWDPVFSTTNTRATQVTPRTTTVNFNKISAAFEEKGVFLKGLIKSSNTTAAIEFKPVDKELKYYRNLV